MNGFLVLHYEVDLGCEFLAGLPVAPFSFDLFFFCKVELFVDSDFSGLAFFWDDIHSMPKLSKLAGFEGDATGPEF
jgi:hypothetical protein